MAHPLSPGCPCGSREAPRFWRNTWSDRYFSGFRRQIDGGPGSSSPPSDTTLCPHLYGTYHDEAKDHTSLKASLATSPLDPAHPPTTSFCAASSRSGHVDDERRATACS